MSDKSQFRIESVNPVSKRELLTTKSSKLEGNCSNPTAINVCKRSLSTCCHLCTWLFWFVIITQSSFILRHHLPITVQEILSYLPILQVCGHFITPTDTTYRPTLGKSRLFLVYVQTTMMQPCIN